MEVTAYDLGQRFVGIKEAKGPTSNAHVLAMLQLDSDWPTDDAVPWCSAFVNYICWLLRLPRSKNLAARSWLAVGAPIPLEEAERGSDIVVFKRLIDDAGPEVLKAAGHVGFYAGKDDKRIWVLGGNQSDMVSVAGYPIERLLGARRLA